MKRIIFALIPLMMLLSACSQKEVIESRYENGNPNVVYLMNKKGGKLVAVHKTIYYENKAKKMEGDMQNDKREGIWKAWYPDGTLWSEGEYKDGMRNGFGYTYHENGVKYIDGFYKDDKKAGVWKFFDEEGKLLKEVDFDKITDTEDIDLEVEN